jgi:hypothetical protein
MGTIYTVHILIQLEVQVQITPVQRNVPCMSTSRFPVQLRHAHAWKTQIRLQKRTQIRLHRINGMGH